MHAVMSLSLLCELSFGSSVSGCPRRTWTVNSDRPRSDRRRQRILVLGDDHERGRAGRHARVLVGRRLRPAGHHQPDVDAIAVHAVRRERPVDLGGQLVPAAADVERDGGGALPQPVEVLLQEHGVPGADPQPLPHAVAEDETGVEDAHDRLRARHEPAVDVDQDLRVARVVGVVVGAVGGRCVGHGCVLPRGPRPHRRRDRSGGTLRFVPLGDATLRQGESGHEAYERYHPGVIGARVSSRLTDGS